MPTKKIYLVSTSHLDREWYFSYEKFRIQICQIINRVLELLSRYSEFRCFMLDGQVCPLLDYLEIYPEKEAIIKEYINNGRFLVGPWYIQPDEAIPSGESHIRNLMIGDRISRAFGKKMNLGYLPDAFGHISQMPQILNGFGLNTAFFTRGVDLTPGRELLWKAPDGSSVTILLMIYGGCSKVDYKNMCNGIRMIDNSVELKSYLDKCLASQTLEQSARNTVVAYCSDHTAPGLNIIKMINEINDGNEEYNVLIASYEEYLDEVMAMKPVLDTIHGELRESIDINVLKDTLASRAYLKRENNIAQKLLMNCAEPLAAIAWLEGEEYPEGLLDTAWKYLLQNHTHDGICGCSTDDVHDEMMIRFRKCRDISSRLSELAARYIAGRINIENSGEGRIPAVVFNPSGYRGNGAVEVELVLKGETKPYCIKIFDMDGNELPGQITSMRAKDNIETDIEVVQRFYRQVVCKVVFCPGAIPAYGYKLFYVQPIYDVNEFFLKKSAFDEMVSVNQNSMENEYIKVEINNDGTFNIIEKALLKEYRGLHYFVDEGDAGDVYTFQKPALDTVFNSRSLNWDISLVNHGPLMARFMLSAEMTLPVSLDGDKLTRSRIMVVNKIKYEISLFAGAKYVCIRTIIDNNSSDHRMRVMFPTGINTPYTYADSQFIVERRGVCQFPALHPMQSFVDVNNDNEGLCVMTRGIHQYEAVKDGINTLALTLLKCQNTLFRVFMTENEEFQGAQCKGENVFEYALYPHSNGWEEAKCHKEAAAFNTDYFAVVTDIHNGALPSEMGIVSVKPEELVITAVKKAAREESLIVRCYNIYDRTVEGVLQVCRNIKAARQVNMNEDDVEEVSCCGSEPTINFKGNSIFIKLKPHQILTVKIDVR